MGLGDCWETHLPSLWPAQGGERRATTRNLSFICSGDGDRTGQTDGVSGAQTTLGYDQADRPTGFTTASTTASYSYDGDGLRQTKTVNGVAEPFVCDLVEGLPLILQDGTTKFAAGRTAPGAGGR